MKKIKHQGSIKERSAKKEAALLTSLNELKKTSKKFEIKQKADEQCSTIEQIAAGIHLAYGTRCIRDISTFTRSLKSKDKDKITLAVAAHLFGKYKVPEYLKECWNSREDRETGYQWVYRWRDQAAHTISISNDELLMMRDWYITIATGGSLYKEHTKGILTKNEVHAFLNCPIQCNFREAVIYALAVQWTDNIGIITKVMKSKLNTNVGVKWIRDRSIWREVIHFYCVNNIPFTQMNDLYDYFLHMDIQAVQRNEVYSLKGRNLQSLMRQMTSWHYEFARVKRMGNSSWNGIPIADCDFFLHGQKGSHWYLEQIKTSKALAAEGTAMHHCVSNYQAQCINGTSSIWSLKVHRLKSSDNPERALTLQINKNGSIVQIRGIANRQARPDELEAIRYWTRTKRLNMSC